MEEEMNITTTGRLLAAGLALQGCGVFNEGRDILEGLTNPLVVQAIVLGADLPDDAQGVTLPSEFSAGSTATAFLADAGNVADLDRAPISGATVRMQSETLGQAAPGTYTLTPGALAYAAGQSWSFSASVGGRNSATATIALADSADFDLPTEHAAGQGFSIDLTGQGFDGAFVVVTDSSGATTFDNRPTDIRGFYELTRGEPAGVVAIPATAFPEPGVYLVGVAGIETTAGRANMSRMNTALSSMLSGNLVFEPMLAQ
jgi:hypothetical protein